MKHERLLQIACKQQALRLLSAQFAFVLVVAVLHRLPLIAVGLGAQSFLPTIDTLESMTALLEMDAVQLLTISGAAALLQWVLGIPLNFGLYRCLGQVMRGEKGRFGTLFDAFGNGKDMMRAFAISLQIALRALLWFGVPAVIYLGVCLLLPVPLWVYDCMTIAYLLSTGVSYCKMRTYSAVYPLLDAQPELSVSQALGKVGKLFQGKLTAMVTFELSFLLWYLLGALGCGVLVLLVMVFETLSFLLYFNELYAPKSQNPTETPDNSVQ